MESPAAQLLVVSATWKPHFSTRYRMNERNETYAIDSNNGIHAARLDEQRLIGGHLTVKATIDERQVGLVGVGVGVARHSAEGVGDHGRIELNRALRVVILQALDDRPNRRRRDVDAL